jgi:hypothetical protein
MKISATVHAPWQTVHERLVRKLRDKGFEARRTFDLQLARRLLKSSEEEPCPHHGTAPCNCQYLAMQIIGHDRSPSAVIIHGHDQTTTISFLTGAGEELRQDTAAAVYEALEHLQAFTRRSPGGQGLSDARPHRSAASRENGRRREEVQGEVRHDGP